ncbi:nuclear transport factor 2 family protein [Spirillospora sp. NPDC048911]|uniref:nuclear transport factor 2 family protein n=1 Tax=Spirillospora sp. NPDC048911 TaxID=3364527 RepID=UPI00370FFD69
MRFVLELHHTSDGIQGRLIRDDERKPAAFNGWLELLRLLEPRPPGAHALVESVRGLVQAENDCDREAASGLLSADCAGITRARGVEQGREQLLSEIAAPQNPLLHREIDVEGAWRSSNLGVVRSIVAVHDPAKRTESPARFRNLHVLTAEGGRWTCLAWQVTELKR